MDPALREGDIGEERLKASWIAIQVCLPESDRGEACEEEHPHPIGQEKANVEVGHHGGPGVLCLKSYPECLTPLKVRLIQAQGRRRRRAAGREGEQPHEQADGEQNQPQRMGRPE